MNREQAKAALPILQAFAEGKRVEFLLSSGNWCELTHSLDPQAMALRTHDYRIKPEPREWWLLLFSNGCFGRVHGNYAAALSDARPFVKTEYEVIHVREVCE